MGADRVKVFPFLELMGVGALFVGASLTFLGDPRPGPVVPLGVGPKPNMSYSFFCLYYLIFSAKTRNKAESDGQQLYFPPYQVSLAAHLLGAVVLVLPLLSFLFSSLVVCCDGVEGDEGDERR